ncbi:MAG: ribose-5-phosphate isomerase RpiA [Fibrobacteria bacterium]|nr:ribose-5-phosphate isomerase RpiA [Fibrobacteria bacterium]
MNSNELKQQVAEKALDWVKDKSVIGLGTGSTARYFIQGLREKIQKENLDVTTVTSSFGSAQLAQELGIPMVSFESVASIDVYVDGADEVDPDNNLIKGQGAAMVQEKILAAASKSFIVIVDDSKLVSHLCEKFPVPVEVIPMAWSKVWRTLESLGATLSIRQAVGKDGPIITDQGNLIIDSTFPATANFAKLDTEINNIPGVLGHGIFLNMATKIIVGSDSGIKLI